MKKLLGLIISIIAVFGVGLFSYSSSYSNRLATNVSGDYPTYQTLEETKQCVDEVVIVNVKKVSPSFIREEKELKGKKLVETDSEVTVKEVKKGNLSIGDEIIIKQDGGEINGKKQVWENTTYLQLGKTYLLYLIKLQNGKYAAFNPIDGVLNIDNGKVKFKDKEYDVSSIN